MSRFSPRIPDAWISLACSLADIARPIAQQYFRTDIEVNTKSDDSPVTIADQMIEMKMRREIEASFPDHGIFGEEFGSVRLDGPAVWVLDPIDGTKSFITGIPTFGTLVACCVDGVPQVGVMDQPIQKERWIGVAGRPTTFNGRPVHTAEVLRLDSASLFVSTPEIVTERQDQRCIEALKRSVGLTQFCADCYGYAMLASGHAHLVAEVGMKPFDFCALVPIVEGAGGVVSDWRGEPATLDSDGRILAAANKTLHRSAHMILTQSQC